MNEEHHKFIARHNARHSVNDLALIMKRVNDAVVGEPGPLVIEAFIALAGEMVAENSDGDEQIDMFCTALAELAKRRRRKFEVIRK